jgi:putative membrane protein
MAGDEGLNRWQSVALWTTIAVYVLGRLCQQFPGPVPVLLIVVLQVVPPAVFAVIHASILYGVRGMLLFTLFCAGAGGICESLSLRIGVPFGHYFFTDLMGPKIFDLPVLLVMAYLGIGYCSWVLAVLILGYRDRLLTGARVLALPLLASLIMVAWDVSMDSIWSNLDHAWVWRDGGSYFGVPISNFLGWYFTAYLFYQAFALYLRANPAGKRKVTQRILRAPIVVYGICALGNLLVFRKGLFPPTATDATGKVWIAGDILIASVLVSLLVMTPFAVLAWARAGRAERHDQELSRSA